MFWRFEENGENLKKVVRESENECIDQRNITRLVSSVQGPAVSSDFDVMYQKPSAYCLTLPHRWLLDTGTEKVDSKNDQWLDFG